MSSGFNMTPGNNRGQAGFALLIVLLFVIISMISIALLLAISQNIASLTIESASAARLRATVLSGVDYAESKLRPLDFDDILKGRNHSADADIVTAAGIQFRNPLSRTSMMESEWSTLSYPGPDDGLLYAGGIVLNERGLELNGCKLFFKVTNNSDDPGGPFHDTDDSVLVRVAGVTPLQTSFFAFRKIRNLCEIVEVRYRRNSIFLGPAAIYAPIRSPEIVLSTGGLIDGLAELNTGVAIGTGAGPAQIRLDSPDQLRGNPAQIDLSDRIQTDSRMRWLADPAFMEHWKVRVSEYATAQSVTDEGAQIYWLPSGVELSGSEVARGIAFSSGGVKLSGSATVEGLLILMDSAALEMKDNSRIRGGVVVLGDQGMHLSFTDSARVEYSPASIMQALQLLPLSRTAFRYVLPDMP